MLTGCSAGATESLVVVPFELVKIRLQDRSSASRYSGPLDCVKQIIKHEGILGMYHGLEPTFWRYYYLSKIKSRLMLRLTVHFSACQACHLEWRLLRMHIPSAGALA